MLVLLNLTVDLGHGPSLVVDELARVHPCLSADVAVRVLAGVGLVLVEGGRRGLPLLSLLCL